MADFAALTNGLATVTGSTSKAAILIADKREKSTFVPIPKPAVKPGSGGVGVSVPSGALNTLKKASNAIKESVVGDAINSVLDNMGKNIEDYVGIDKEFQKAFGVQFNPASLNISGYSGGSQDIIDYSEAGRSAKTTPLEPNYSLSFTLIFDQMELQNCFPMDILDFNLSTAAKSAMKAVTVASSGLSISVQAITEGLIGALYNPKTRYVGFLWGPLLYKGVLKSVNARYTMFDMVGRPVRSQVGITMYLADKDIKQAGAKSNLGMWTNAYKKAFIDTASAGAQRLKVATDIVNTILGD